MNPPLDEDSMSRDKKNNELEKWMLFPEVIGVLISGVLLPLPLLHLAVSGHALLGITGLLLWLSAAIFTVFFIRRRQYGMAYFPMLALICLFIAVYKICQ